MATDLGLARARAVRGLVLALHRTTDVVRALASTVPGATGIDPNAVAARSGLTSLSPDKVLGEAALLLRASRSLSDDVEVAPVWRSLAAATASTHDPAGLAAVLCISPADAWDRAFTHLHLRALGLVDDGLDPLLAIGLPGAGAPGRELLPSLQLERAWLEDVWRGREGGVGVSVDATILGRGVDVLAASMTDLYLLTHAAMYLSDVGRRSPGTTMRVDDAEAALAIALDDDNLDLACEVLWLWPMLGLSVTPLAAFAHAIVEAAVAEVGFVPGPTHDTAARALLTGDEGSFYDLCSSYHATLVHGILCAAWLRHPSVVPPWQPRRRQVPAPAVGERRWEAALRSWNSEEAGDLSAMVTTAAVRRAAQARDLVALRAAIDHAVTTGACELPATVQAVGALRRATLLARQHALAT